MIVTVLRSVIVVVVVVAFATAAAAAVGVPVLAVRMRMGGCKQKEKTDGFPVGEISAVVIRFRRAS